MERQDDALAEDMRHTRVEDARPVRDHGVAPRMMPRDALERLRALGMPEDWRRGRPHPEAEALAAAIGAAAAPGRGAAALDVRETAEAAARLAALRHDPVGTLEGLVKAARVPGTSRAWAMAEIHRLAQSWRLVVRGLLESELAAVQVGAEATLRELVEALPKNPHPRVALARVMAQVRGFDAGLAALEGAPPDHPLVRRTVFSLLLQALHVREMLDGDRRDEAEEAATVARCMRPPPEILAAAGDAAPDLLAFRFHRAVALATLRGWLEEERGARTGAATGTGDGAGSDPLTASLAAVPAAELDIGAALGAALRLLPAMPSEAAAQYVLDLAGHRVLQDSPLAAAEAARVELLRRLLAACAAPETPAAALRPLVERSFGALTNCVAFWQDEEFRRAGCRRLLERLDAVPEPPRSLFRGKLTFLLGDLDAARDAFAAAARLEPARPGPATYIDPREVPRILAARAADPRPPLGAAGLRFETLATAARGGAAAGTAAVVASANERYLRLYGRTYVETLRAIAPTGRLHLHLIGDPVSARDEIGALAEAAGPGYDVTFSSEPIELDETWYFATARFLRMPLWLERLGPLLVTDIDWRWSAPQAPRLDARFGGGADVGLWLRREVGRLTLRGERARRLIYPQVNPWARILAGVIALAPTDGARRFAAVLGGLADAALREAAAVPGRKWCIDQNILLAAYEHTRRRHPEVTFHDVVGGTDAAGLLVRAGVPT
jgi:hypothetical protein